LKIHYYHDEIKKRPVGNLAPARKMDEATSTGNTEMKRSLEEI
jgi:hypothetical protein